MGIFCIFSLGVFMIFSPASRHLGMAFTPNRNEACQTREPRGLSPSGGKTPAKPHVPRAPCAPMARSPGCRGGERKRVSSGHNRRRRLATGSRQPKRGFDTAVSKTTIEVAGHCPCEACQTREPRGLLPSGGKTRPSCMSRYAPCPPSAGSPGSRGTAPWGRGGSSRMSLRPKCSRKRSVVA